MPTDVRIDQAREAVTRLCESVAFPQVDWGIVADRAEEVFHIADLAQRMGDEPVMWISGLERGAVIDIAAPTARADDERP